MNGNWLHKKERWGWRIVVTILLLVASGTFTWLYRSVQPPLEWEIALQQMTNSDMGYVVANTVMRGIIPQVVGAIVGLLLLSVRVPPI